MENKSEILKRGELIYQTERPYTGANPRGWADGSRPWACILAEERFVTNHDDAAGFVEILDDGGRVVRCWKFDYPMTKRFADPDYYDDDCLILYLRETFHLPVIGDRATK